MKVILALDQGTTSSRAIVFDQGGEIVSVAQKEFRQIFPQPGWVEHDPEEIWSSQISVAYQALAKARVSAKDVAAIGIANQRETTLLWERATGKPVANAIVWQDRRTASICDELNTRGLADSIQKKNRFGNRSLLFRHQAGLAVGARAELPPTRGKRRARIRHGG